MGLMSANPALSRLTALQPFRFALYGQRCCAVSVASLPACPARIAWGVRGNAPEQVCITPFNALRGVREAAH